MRSSPVPWRSEVGKIDFHLKDEQFFSRSMSVYQRDASIFTNSPSWEESTWHGHQSLSNYNPINLFFFFKGKHINYTISKNPRYLGWSWFNGCELPIKKWHPQQPTEAQRQGPQSFSHEFQGWPGWWPNIACSGPHAYQEKNAGMDSGWKGDGWLHSTQFFWGEIPHFWGEITIFWGEIPIFWWFNSTIFGVSLLGLNFMHFNLQALPKPRRGFWPRCNSRAAGGLDEVASIFHGFTYKKLDRNGEQIRFSQPSNFHIDFPSQSVITHLSYMNQTPQGPCKPRRLHAQRERLGCRAPAGCRLIHPCWGITPSTNGNPYFRWSSEQFVNAKLMLK